MPEAVAFLQPVTLDVCEPHIATATREGGAEAAARPFILDRSHTRRAPRGEEEEEEEDDEAGAGGVDVDEEEEEEE